MERVKYQALVWYKSDKANPDIPSPSKESWEMEKGQLAIKWSEGELPLLELVQVRTEDPDTHNDNDSRTCELG